MKILEALVASGHLHFLDLCLARELLKETISEKAAALICHLSLSARQGHLCIVFEEGKIFPDPYLTWSESRTIEQGFFDESIADYLCLIPKMIADGVRELPPHLLTDLTAKKTDIFAIQTPLCRIDNRFYFQRYWFYEASFLHYYRRFIAKSPHIRVNQENLQLGRDLLPEQKKAILASCESSLTLICGGPGTGKTYTAGKLVSLLWESLSPTQREKFRIALAAPTGKAAANLQKSITKAAKGSDQLLTLQAKTLHALLGIKTGNPLSEISPLSFDLVIVDECSMIDVRMMAALFAAMKPGSRLVLLGDKHQLPAVEAGSLFADLVQNDQNHSSHYQVCELEKCLRVELKGILDVASKINQGDIEGTIQLFNNASSRDGVYRLLVAPALTKDTAIAKKLCRYAFDQYELQNLRELAPEEILEHFNGFRVLSPLRKGFFGVEEMNRMTLQEHKNWISQTRGMPFIAPIMILKNDYRLELFNGEVGVLIRSSFYAGDFEFVPGDYALFYGKDGQVKRIPALLLPAFEYAYCISVHKSQGSEFDRVLLLLPQGSECFGRELLYTAVTRARRQLTLWTNDQTFSQCIERKTSRLSGFSPRNLVKL